jgi:transposase
MKPYSVDLRRRVVQAYREGNQTLAEVAQQFRVGPNFVQRMVLKAGADQSLQPHPHRGGPQRALHGRTLLVFYRLLAADPTATLAELAQRLEQVSGVRVSAATVGLTLKRLGFRRKRTSPQAQERDRPAVQAQRALFRQAQPTWSADRLVVLDESGVNGRLHRRYGWARDHQRVVQAVPLRRYPRWTLIGALTLDGLETWRIVRNGSVNTAIFTRFVQEELRPVLQPGDIVILDNFKPHHADAVQTQLTAAGVTVQFLPPYSPDFSPIELAWGKLKLLLKLAGARTAAALEGALRRAREAITPADAEHWFQHCGYHLVD